MFARRRSRSRNRQEQEEQGEVVAEEPQCT